MAGLIGSDKWIEDLKEQQAPEQAHFVGSAKWSNSTGDWSGAATDGLFHNFPANTNSGSATVTGKVTVVDDNLLSITIPNAKKGVYKVNAQGSFYSDVSGFVYFRLYDGSSGYGSLELYGATTLSTGIEGSIPHLADGDLTISIQYAEGVANGARVLTNTTNRTFEMSVTYLPPQPE